MARAPGAIAVVLACLLILTPVLWASTAETWTNGIYDYESADVVEAIAHNAVAAVHSNPIASFAGALVAVGRLVLSDQTFDLEVVPSARHTRGPPLA
jgi:hypothetical protein